MSTQALTYAAFIAETPDASTLQAICKAAGADVTPSMAKLFANLLEKKSVEEMLSNVSFGGGGAAPAAAAPAAGGAAAAAAPAKEESEEDDDMGMDLFD